MEQDFAPGGRGVHLLEKIDRQIDAGNFTSLEEGLRGGQHTVHGSSPFSREIESLQESTSQGKDRIASRPQQLSCSSHPGSVAAPFRSLGKRSTLLRNRVRSTAAFSNRVGWACSSLKRPRSQERVRRRSSGRDRSLESGPP